MLAYMIKAYPHTHRGAQRGSGEGEAQTTPCSGSLQAHPRSNQPITGHLYKIRGTQGHKGRWEPKLRSQRKGHPIWVTPWAIPGDPHPQCPGVIPNSMSQWWSTFRSEGGVYPRGAGHVLGCVSGLLWTYDVIFR